jgi:hypothetical protein
MTALAETALDGVPSAANAAVVEAIKSAASAVPRQQTAMEDIVVSLLSEEKIRGELDRRAVNRW